MFQQIESTSALSTLAEPTNVSSPAPGQPHGYDEEALKRLKTMLYTEHLETTMLYTEYMEAVNQKMELGEFDEAVKMMQTLAGGKQVLSR